MQASSRSRSSGVRYAYRPVEEEEQERPQQDDVDESEAADLQEAADSSNASSSSGSSSSSWFDQVNSNIGSACSSAIKAVRDRPAAAAGVAVGVAAACAAVAVVKAIAKGKQSNSSRGSKSSQKEAAAASSSSSGGKASKGSKAKAGKKAAAPAAPGPNSKVKPSKTCVPLADGSAVVVLRPIAADNSCLFNAVGYNMHHSTNRAPFLRQVVSREVSSDPQEYSAAFLGMENAAYCAWITNPAHWGGGIELAILAAHYRREIAAWNLASGACHVFGEERGYTKQVMVIYTGTHYDALAIAASPRADPDDDITEFNPRTKRGKMILAAAQQLVKLHRKGKPSHHEQQQEKEQQEKQAAAADGSSSNKQQANGPAAVGAADRNSSSSGADHQQQLLSCGSCGLQLQGVDAAKQHAAATGHTEFEEVSEQQPVASSA